MLSPLLLAALFVSPVTASAAPPAKTTRASAAPAAPADPASPAFATKAPDSARSLKAPSAASPSVTVPDARAARLDARLWQEFSKQTKDIHCTWIRAADLMRIIDDTDLVLIDVRQPAEQEISMLAHAVTPKQFAEKFRHGIPAQKRLVVYCTIGFRSGKYAEELAKQNIKAENLEGGLLAWSHAGGDFYMKDAAGNAIKTTRVHVYDKGWNFLHPDYQAVW
jgi:rhodanese-related sulfurtransferase